MSLHNFQDKLERAHLSDTLSALLAPAGTLFGAGSTVGNGIQGWAPGAIFIDTNAPGGSQIWVNEGTKTAASWKAMAVQQGSAGFLSIPLNAWREAAAFDVGAITANGGILASDTTPVLSAINDATDGCQRILWASSNNDQIITSIPLPPDLDTDSDLVLHTRIASGGTTNAVGFTVDSFFNEGDTKVVDTSETNQTTGYLEKIATIAAADIPTGAQILTLGLTPAAHTTDTLALTAAWLEYTRKVAA